ncbi:MAG: ABC transporter ATP-binding protein [Deltaproteobacteria bacterium]|nr:ABC transporter ATP-binding protein [Deltaproteobacteria bacterium]
MILELNDVKKHFHLGHGRALQAVDGITLSLSEKEVVGLVGESGCGKSTLARVIVGLYNKTAGYINYRGEQLPNSYRTRDFRRYARKINMIFQDPYSALDPRMTVREIIAEGPLLHELWQRSQVVQKVGEWLDRVGLAADHMSRYSHEFSGGQRQRLGIARALALAPELLICDEPISALDVSVQAQVVNLLAELKHTLGLTLLFIAHDLSMVRYVSDRIAVMYLGRIVELGPADTVYFQPQHPYTQLLISSNPEADPKYERQRKPLDQLGEVPSPINMPDGCRFATRCPYVMPACRERDPGWHEVGQNHFVACINVNMH